MNKILNGLIILLILSSCAGPKPAIIRISASHDASEPNKNNFIQLKDSTEIILPNRTDLMEDDTYLSFGLTTKLKIGKEKFKAKNINAFQINSIYYKNIENYNSFGYSAFAKRIYRGPFNIYSHYDVSRSVDSKGSSTTEYTLEYYFQKPDVKENKLVSIRKNDVLELYLKDYKPSMELLKKYNEVRRKSARDKWIVLGAWIASIPLTQSKNKTVSTIFTVNATLGIFYVPVYLVTHKANKINLKYQAIQTYIDNNFSQSSLLLENKKTEDSSQIKLTSTEKQVVDSDKLDFVVLESGKKIEARVGTSLESANFQSFKINDQVLKENVVALQQNQVFYKQIYKTSDFKDYAYRYVKGKVNIYENNLDLYSKKIKVSNAFFSRNNNAPSALLKTSSSFLKQSFFEYNNNNKLIANTMQLGSFFNDNAIAKDKYTKYQNHVRVNKLINYSLLSLSLLADVYVFKYITDQRKIDPSDSDNKIQKADAFLLLNSAALITYIIPSFRKKDHLNKELLDIVDYYNKH